MTPIPTELRELLERIVAGDVGRMIYAKLATGQATETDDGKAWLELRALLATPPADAADMGGQAGEEVEVVAYRHWGDASRLIPRIGKDRALPDSYADEFTIPLMTVAQHQRIVAVLSAQQSDPWAPSGADCDSNILRNPDAKAWADFFVATFPGQADKHGLMIGWFANAMMAMHDHLKAQQPAHVSVPRGLLERTICRLTHGHEHDKAVRELRALLNGGEANG